MLRVIQFSKGKDFGENNGCLRVEDANVICQPLTDKEKSDMIQVLGAMFRLYNFDLLVR